ncbi:MAG: hypothetical protein ACKVT0_21765, partial [Planctomycetaceae bacterium]
MLSALALVMVCSNNAGADEHLQTSKEYYSQLFVQNSPLDRLKKRSAKHRWNQLRRERLKSADANEKSPEKLDGSPASPVPLPEIESVPKLIAKPAKPAAVPLVIDQKTSEKIGVDEDDVPARNSQDEIPSVSTKNPVRIPVKSPAVEVPVPPTVEALQPEPRSVPVPDISSSILPQADDTYREPARSPAELKSITTISPFRNYEPDMEFAANDPCN